MKMKKFISGLLTFALLLGLMPAALAAGTPTVSISSGEVKAGETVTLTVSIKDNPGLATCMLYLYFDTDVFSPAGVYGMGKFADNGGVMTNTIEAAKETGRYNGAPNKDGILMLWYNSMGVDTAEDGTVFVVNLSAREDAANGDYTVSLGYSGSDTCNRAGDNVKLTFSNGVVTLDGGKDVELPEQENPADNSDDVALPEQDDPVDDNPEDEEDPEPVVPVFPDAQDHWAQEYIEKAAELGLIVGNELGMYMPDKTMTRAECVTILWRACGSPKPTKVAEFTDLDPKQTWYHDAVAWASETGVVNGIGNNKFDPLRTLNRDQLATILFRMAGGKSGIESMFSGIYDDTYSDSSEIASWAKKGVYWSIYNNILCGDGSVALGEQLKPATAADRAQIAVMIVRYLELN